ncbi:hypothetical protein V8D89_004119 [Ganoderma adspersum]
MFLLVQWTVEKLPNGRYKLQNRRAAIGTVDGHLFAFLVEAGTLLVTLDIFKADDGRGWVVAEAPDPSGEDVAKISVRPLIVMPSEPPVYPPTEVFVFKKVEYT